MADDDRVQGLVQLWGRLEARWDDAPAARLRRDVIGPFQAAGPGPGGWLDQAAALLAWQELLAERARAAADDRPDWAALGDMCRQLRQRLEEEQRGAKPRMFGLLQPSKDQLSLLTDLARFLGQCQDTFTQMTAVAPTERPTDPVVIERRIEHSLATTPADWPPPRLATFIRQFGCPPELRTRLTESGDRWRATLGEALPDVSVAALDVLVLVRGLLDGLGADAPPAAWPALLSLARELLPSGRLQIELARFADQPADWFEPAVEAEIPAPRVERVGLAIRAAQRPWFCFPRGRQQVPKPPQRSPALDAAEQLVRIAAAHPELHEIAAYGPAVLEVCETSRPTEQVAAELLDALAAVSADAATADAALTALRNLCAAIGLAVLPVGWTFGGQFSRHQLSDSDGDVAVLFRSDVPADVVIRVQRFGLRRDNTVVRKCAVVVSAGRAPDGFAELEDLLQKSAGDSAHAVLQRLKEWRMAALDGTLEMAAVQFFVDYWGDLGVPLRTADAGNAQEFAQRLSAVLHRGFRLFTFHPAAYQDFPDGWLQRVAGRQMTSGRVRRVVRPGLQDEHSHLRVPALVEVE
jgi:hypothetical protein